MRASTGLMKREGHSAISDILHLTLLKHFPLQAKALKGSCDYFALNHYTTWCVSAPIRNSSLSGTHCMVACGWNDAEHCSSAARQTCDHSEYVHLDVLSAMHTAVMISLVLASRWVSAGLTVDHCKC